MFAVFRRLFGRMLEQLGNPNGTAPEAGDLRRNILRAYRRRLMTGAITGKFQRGAKVARPGILGIRRKSSQEACGVAGRRFVSRA